MKLRQQVFYLLNEKELENIIKEQLNRSKYLAIFNTDIALQGVSTYFTSYERRQIENFLNNPEFGLNYQLLINYLVTKGILPDGNYVLSNRF